MTPATRTLTAIVAVTLALVTAQLAAGKALRSTLSARVNTMSTPELVAQRGRSERVITFFTRRHRWMLAQRHATCWTHVPWSRTCDRARQLVAYHRQLLDLVVSRLEPPHHLLWMCIHGLEARDWANRDTGHNGHYGGLQMHPKWGHGTSYYASDDSELVQETAAEEGYKDSGYSRAWLLGQWYHPQCLVYA